MLAKAVKWAICLSITAVCWVSQAAPSRGASSLKFEQRSHDFGDVYRGAMLKHRFSFVNAGNGSLVIQGVHAACGCTVVLAEPGKEYQPGEKGFVEVQFDTKDFTGQVVKVVTVMSNEPLMPDRVLTIKANVKSEVEAEPPIVNFGDVLAESGAEKTFHIRPIGGFALNVTGLIYDEKIIDVKLGPRDAQGSYEVKVHLRNGIKPQFIKSMITVKNNSSTLAELPVPIRASIKGAFDVSPSYVEFGAIPGRNQVERTVTLSGPPGALGLAGHRVELNINGRRIEGSADLVKISTKLQGQDKDRDRQSIVMGLTNDTRYAGSVHGKLFLQTGDVVQPEIAVDFYAFFR